MSFHIFFFASIFFLHFTFLLLQFKPHWLLSIFNHPSHYIQSKLFTFTFPRSCFMPFMFLAFLLRAKNEQKNTGSIFIAFDVSFFRFKQILLFLICSFEFSAKHHIHTLQSKASSPFLLLFFFFLFFNFTHDFHFFIKSIVFHGICLKWQLLPSSPVQKAKLVARKSGKKEIFRKIKNKFAFDKVILCQ